MTYRTVITRRPRGTLALLNRTLDEALVMVPYDDVENMRRMVAQFGAGTIYASNGTAITIIDVAREAI